MKPEEAIKHYIALKEDYLSRRSFMARERIDEISKEVISMLEKQVAKKPIEGATFKHIGKCPDCRQVISTRSAFRNCQYCGQKIDWGNEE